MKSTRDGAVKAPPAGMGAASEEVRQTLLLPMLLERFDPEQPLTVLDAGFGVPETVTFFAGFRCRLHFAGLYDNAALDALSADADDDDQASAEERLETAFARMLAVKPQTRFDICLLWDFLNYLPVPALQAFSNVLRTYLHRDTMGHGFGAFKANAPAMSGAAPERALQYGVLDEQRLMVRPRQDFSAPPYSHSRATLAASFNCFEIARGTLLREGTMELLLRAR